MRFLVDAQLPVRLARRLTEAGHDAVHSSALPAGNRTTDAEIGRRADAEDRVVVTKDRDFRDGHLLRARPRRLLIVATGNIDNRHLVTSSISTSTTSSARSPRSDSSSSLQIGSSSTRIADGSIAAGRRVLPLGVRSGRAA